MLRHHVSEQELNIDVVEIPAPVNDTPPPPVIPAVTTAPSDYD